MNLSPKTSLTISANIYRALGLILYVFGAMVGFVAVGSADKVARVGGVGFLFAALAVFVGGFLALGIVRLGHDSYLHGKRLFARRQTLNALDLLSQGGTPPVLYLRSFADDEIAAETRTAYNFQGVQLPSLSTEEEHLAKAIGNIGPFIAVADIDEKLPHLGAKRVTASKNWRSSVTSLMSRSQLVIFRVGFGKSLWWEIEQALELVDRQRLLFLIPNEPGVLKAFRERLQPMLSAELPDFAGEMQTASTIGAILYFDSSDVPRLSPLVTAKYHANDSQPLFPMLRIAIRPIYQQLGLKWMPPPIPRRNLAGTLLAAWGLGVSIYWACEIKIWELPFTSRREVLPILILLDLIVIVPLAICAYYFFGGLFSIYFASKEFKEK